MLVVFILLYFLLYLIIVYRKKDADASGSESDSEVTIIAKCGDAINSGDIIFYCHD